MNINRWIFQIPLDDIRESYRFTETGETCICCGKSIKQVRYYVHLLTNGNLVSSDQQFGQEEDQGFFPIGNACKNKLPNNFYFKAERG